MTNALLERTEEIRKQMKSAGLSRIAPAVLKLLRPSIRLHIGEQSTQAVARLGGSPNMPANIEWPTRRSGDPLSFLAQISLEQLWAFEGLPLPSSGSLFFFCDAAYLPAGSDPRDNDGIKVIYSKSSLTENPLRSPPAELDADFIFKGFSLKPALDLTAPPRDIWEIESLHLTDAESSSYAQLFDGDGPIHRIGGYPNILQNNELELTAELVSHGVNCEDSNAVRAAKSGGLGAGAVDWRLLLQLGSEEDAGMMWGDVGNIFFMIRESDLKALRFERVWMDWQCN